jgi:hypothetical protein
MRSELIRISFGSACWLKIADNLCLLKIKSKHIRGANCRGLGGRIRPALFTVRDRGASLSKAKCVRVSLYNDV